jgi:hypothetical protein
MSELFVLSPEDLSVWKSSTLKNLVAGSGLVFEDAGEHELKVPDRWHLHRVVK